MATVSGRRHLRQHEDLLGCTRLWLSLKHLLSFEGLAVVPDGRQIQLHLLSDGLCTRIDTRAVLVLNDVERKSSSWQIDALHHLELNLSDPEVLLAVVDSDHGIGNFI